MVDTLKKLAYYGGVLIIILGIILMLKIDNSNHKPQLLIEAIQVLVFVTGSAVLLIVFLRGLKR